MKRITIKLSSAILLCLLTQMAVAQTLPVGTPVLDDYYRRAQLSGKIDSNIPFAVRPLYPAVSLKKQNVFNPDTTDSGTWTAMSPVIFAKGAGKLMILPLEWQQQYNSHHPYGWNDGLMIPAKGYQTMISGGLYVSLGPVSVQLRPEYVYAANPTFPGYASGHDDTGIYNYFYFHRLIDWPEKFGAGSYTKASWGQSSIRLNLGPLSLGLSNENLWWGPGIQNALVMTNNAPGFKHITLNTTRPIKTVIGGFEGQIIAGRLDDSGYPPLLTTTLSDGTNIDTVRTTGWRYFTGFNINYHPRWVPGLTLGFIRTFDSYYNDVKSRGFSAYLPFFTPFQKANIDGGAGDSYPRDQITSLYARWLFTKAKAEVYFEYGREDNSYNLSDFFGSPQHSMAYVFGLRKLIPLAAKDRGILFSAEITQTSQSIDKMIRETALWYTNYQVTEGHTQEGQILGAGTGPGGNIQSVDLSWVYGLKKLGVSFDRYEHDVDFSDYYFQAINGYSRKWVDFAFGVHGDWNYKNFLINAKLQAVKSLNYEWILKNYDPAAAYYIPNNSVFNLHTELGISYRF